MRRQELILGLAGLLLGSFALTWFLAPRVTDFSPDGGGNSAVQPVVIDFSRRVNPESAAPYFHMTPPVNGRFTVDGRQLLFLPDHPLDYNQSYTVTLSPGLRAQNGLPLLRGVSWQFQIGRPHITYLRQDESSVSLWASSLENETAARQLIGDVTDIWDYNLTPDGRSLLLSIFGPAGNQDLVLLDAASGRRHLLLACPESQCRDARWQPQGTVVAYERIPLLGASRLSQVWLLDTVSGQSWPAHPVDLLAPAGIRTQTSRHPRWSADGRYLAYYKTDAFAVVVLDMTGGEPLLIPANLNEMGGWSPVAYQLAYTEFTQSTPDLLELLQSLEEEGQGGQNEPPPFELEEPAVVTHLIVTNLVTETTVDISEGLVVSDGRPAWRPDGQSIVFTRATTGGARQLWLVSLAANERSPRPLTSDAFTHHTAPAWSPDGRYLAFMRAPLEGQPGRLPAIWIYDSQNEGTTLVGEGIFLPGWLP